MFVNVYNVIKNFVQYSTLMKYFFNFQRGTERESREDFQTSNSEKLPGKNGRMDGVAL